MVREHLASLSQEIPSCSLITNDSDLSVSLPIPRSLRVPQQEKNPHKIASFTIISEKR